jgi:hypothetical protein
MLASRQQIRVPLTLMSKTVKTSLKATGDVVP